MEMKPFVPPDALEYFKEVLDGIPGKESGAREMIKELKIYLESTQKKWDTSDSNATQPPREARNPFLVTGHDADFSRVIPKSLEEYERIVKNIDILSNCDDMDKAYKRLKKEFTTREQWHDFLYSALAADSAYSRHRVAVERGKELAPEIDATATKLADLLLEFGLIDFDNFPLELSSIWHLLNVTSSKAWQGRDPEKRLKLKGAILGDSVLTPEPPHLSTYFTYNPSALAKLLTDDAKRVARVAQRNNELVDDSQLDQQNAWRAAPTITTLLRYLAKSAEKFKPVQKGMIGIATSSPKGPRHYQYMKGFAYLLIKRGIRLTPNIKNAIHTITVLIMKKYNPDFKMEYRSVNHALKDFPRA